MINKTEDKVVTRVEGVDEELRAGTVVEREHLPTYTWLMQYVEKNEGSFPPLTEFAKHIALDHLREYKDYYTKLSTIVNDVPAIQK